MECACLSSRCSRVELELERELYPLITPFYPHSTPSSPSQGIAIPSIASPWFVSCTRIRRNTTSLPIDTDGLSTTAPPSLPSPPILCLPWAITRQFSPCEAVSQFLAVYRGTVVEDLSFAASRIVISDLLSGTRLRNSFPFLTLALAAPAGKA